MRMRYVLVAALLLAGASILQAEPGKFYLVGVGPAPDLVTLRGQEVIKKADVFLIHDPPGPNAFKDFTGDREVWIHQHSIYALLGVDPAKVENAEDRALVIKYEQDRRAAIDRIRKAVQSGKNVVSLEADDPMIFGIPFYLEMLKDVPTEVVPGIGILQAAAAALKRSPVYGWDTNAAILTMSDWEGRADTNERLMAMQTNMVFYAFHLDYPLVFGQLKRHYSAETAAAVVCFPGDPARQKVITSTVGRFLEEVDTDQLPPHRHLLMVGKFIEAGQARADGLRAGKAFAQQFKDSSSVTGSPPESAATARPTGTSPGRFYIVGMGLTPDLITLRAVKALKEADVFIINGPDVEPDWKPYTAGKEVWSTQRALTRYMGIDPDQLEDPAAQAQAIENAAARKELIGRIARAVREGKTVAVLEGGDPMFYGMTYYVELLPPDVPSEIIPGVGAFQAATAAVQRCPTYGWDTSAAIITMSDWPGRSDTNEKLMATQSSMIFYTMHLDYEKLFEQLKRHYPADTPVAVVAYAGDHEREKVYRSTVGGFLKEVPVAEVPKDKYMLLVGKFLTVGQARKDGLLSSKKFMERLRAMNKPGAATK